jgi:hypothetical protein
VVCVLVLPSFALGWSIGHDALRTTSSSYVEKQVRCVVYTRFTSPSKKVLCQIFQSLGARTVISFLVCDGASQHQLVRRRVGTGTPDHSHRANRYYRDDYRRWLHFVVEVNSTVSHDN